MDGQRKPAQRLADMIKRVVLVLAVLVGTVHAEDKKAARDAYRAGTQHYDLGEYKEALSAFKDAYRNFEDPVFLFNIAQCQRQLGESQNAARQYRMYLLKVPDAQNREEVRALIARLEKTIAEEQANKLVAPQGTQTEVQRSPIEPAPPVAVVTTARPPAKPPIYKRWWLWTIVGAVVVAGVAVGAGVGATQSGQTPTAQTNLGTIKF
jgi:tetratricopeptide (TPR) repeat protein